MSFVGFLATHRDEFLRLLGQHVLLVVLSTGAAVAVGVPVGILAAKRPRAGAPIVWFANVVQTIPSLAMFGFLLPLPFVGGLGARVAVVVLILYALLPVIRTTVAGLRSVDRALIDAGTALGMTAGQLLRQVELPLALPSIVAGIRVAAVIGVGTATIAAAVGAGGLGEYIFRGLSMVDSTVILAGAVPAALLALVVDGGLLLAERLFRARHRPPLAVAAAVAAGVLLGAVAILSADRGLARAGAIRVGSKNFTEQIVLGEIVAQSLEAHGLRVDRRLNLGGTFICDRALRSGDLDVYVEYSGTADTAVFKDPVDTDPARVLERVRRKYAEAGITVLPPLGYDNTFAILVRGDDARRYGLHTIDDAVGPARAWRAGFGYEFLQREDGFPGLARVYGLHFAAAPVAMDLSLIYRALQQKQVDLIAGDATSGLIAAYGLTMLQDDRHYFPPYDAVPLVRSAVALQQPAVREALSGLAGRVRLDDIRAMNRAVDVNRQDPAAVARAFLARLEREHPSKG